MQIEAGEKTDLLNGGCLEPICRRAACVCASNQNLINLAAKNGEGVIAVGTDTHTEKRKIFTFSYSLSLSPPPPMLGK